MEAAARAAAAAGVPHFSLVSAQGARAGLWASDLKPFHGLLYAKTKGLVRRCRCPRSRLQPLGSVCPGCQPLHPTGRDCSSWLASWGGCHSLVLPHPSTACSRHMAPPMLPPPQAEEAVKSSGFAYATIMRPGLLERGQMARGLEKAVAKLWSSVPVSQVGGKPGHAPGCVPGMRQAWTCIGGQPSPLGNWVKGSILPNGAREQLPYLLPGATAALVCVMVLTSVLPSAGHAWQAGGCRHARGGLAVWAHVPCRPVGWASCCWRGSRALLDLHS